MKNLELGENPLVWWTDEKDCNQIEDIISKYSSRWESLPSYIQDEFEDRCGRTGRGRLWISDKLRVPKREIEIPRDLFNQNPFTEAIAEHYGGIVIREKDGLILCAYPGKITNLHLEVWQPKRIS